MINHIIQSIGIESFINTIESEMLKREQVDCPVIHHFSPGLYVRELNMKAGIFALGHRQKKEHLNIFLKGKVEMINDDGTTSILSAPMIFTGKPGRKAGYVLEDVVWLNVYPTNVTDVKTLESMFLDKSPIWENSQITQDERVEDKEDFLKAINEYGFSEEIVREQSENIDDQIPFESGSYAVAVFPSNIEGLGLFATATFKNGDIIAPARIRGKRTPAGRFTNHSKKPNAIMKEIDDNIFLVATSKINGCKGGIIGDEITIDYRESLKLVLKIENGERICLE